MSDWYCEIVDCRACGAKTGRGAAWPTEEEARAGFEKARALEVSVERAEFLVELHDDKGDLLDTVQIDASGFEVLIGEVPESAAFYTALDTAYWRRRWAMRDASAAGLA